MLDVKLKLKPGHTNERTWRQAASLGTLFWNMTYACNYRCKVCYASAGQADPEELTTREALDLVNCAHAAGVRDIIISGGEPVMRKDLVDVLKQMAKLGMTARIASNGSLLTDDLLRRLRQETLTKSFQISLDTVDPELYRTIHGAGPNAFGSVLGALECIQKHGFHTTVSVRVMPETLPGIPELLDYACAEGLSTVTLHLPLHTGRTRGAFPQDADVLSLLEPVFEHFLSLPTHWLIETYIPWAPYHPVIRHFQEQVRFVHRGCVAGRDRLTINPTGWISPCVCLDVPAAYVGNVRRDDLLDVFQNSPLCKMLRQPQEHGICTSCPEVGRCGGGCRASAFVLTGKLDGQDKSCPVWQRMSAAAKATVNDKS